MKKTAEINEEMAKRALANSVEVSYFIECSRCRAKLEHSFDVPPDLNTDIAFVADMAYDAGWLAAGGKYESTGECNGDFVIYPLCRQCIKPDTRQERMEAEGVTEQDIAETRSPTHWPE